MRCVSVCFLLFLSHSLAQKLPANIKKCAKNQSDFEKCLIDSAHQVLSLLDKDAPGVNLKSLEPFAAGTFTLPTGTKIVQFAQKYNNLRFYGFKSSKITKFEFDFAKNTITLEFEVPKLQWEFEADFNGKLYSEPFVSKGPGTITMKNVKILAIMTLEESTEVDGKHLRVIKTGLGMKPSEFTIKLSKAQSGPEDKTEYFNKKFNDNLEAIWAEIRPNYDEFFGELVAENFNRVFIKIPISELF